MKSLSLFNNAGRYVGMAYKVSTGASVLGFGAGIATSPVVWATTTAALAACSAPVSTPVVAATVGLHALMSMGAVGAAAAAPYAAADIFSRLFSSNDSDSTPELGVNVVIPTENMPAVDEAVSALGDAEVLA